jgi:hypothetical protein
VNTITRRHFLRTLGAVAIMGMWPAALIPAQDIDPEPPVATALRQRIAPLLTGRNMALDLRRINPDHAEAYRIQFNADALYPVASCFKAFGALYYFYVTPQSYWQNGPDSAVYRSVVFSNNPQSGDVLVNAAQWGGSSRNAIERFNTFLRTVVGMADSGMYRWNYPNSPTQGMTDERYAPSETRNVRVGDATYYLDNLFTAADMARGYDVIVRGTHFSRNNTMRTAILATQALLRIPAPDYRAPLEYAVSHYMGKDGVLPAEDVPQGLGRVLADAGAITINNNTYLIAFMCAGESETSVREILIEIVRLLQNTPD